MGLVELANAPCRKFVVFAEDGADDERQISCSPAPQSAIRSLSSTVEKSVGQLKTRHVSGRLTGEAVRVGENFLVQKLPRLWR